MPFTLDLIELIDRFVKAAEIFSKSKPWDRMFSKSL